MSILNCSDYRNDPRCLADDDRVDCHLELITAITVINIGDRTNNLNSYNHKTPPGLENSNERMENRKNHFSLFSIYYSPLRADLILTILDDDRSVFFRVS